MNKAPAIEVLNLDFQIGKQTILDQLSLSVDAQQYFAIAGINGAGKSTLIKLILDLLRPTRCDQLKLMGKPNQQVQTREQLAYLPEKFDLKISVNGWQYLRFVAAMFNQSIDQRAIKELAEQLDFKWQALDKKTASYSKGMVQKLGLISCFMLEKPLLILDEPLSGLDPMARYHFKALLQQQKKKGLTLLYSTHLLADAAEVCDRFGILHQGRMIYVGTPDDCIDRFQAESLEQAYMNCIEQFESR